MTAGFDKGNRSELDADITLFEEISSARMRFYDEIVDCRSPDSTVAVRELRQETVFVIAEFFWLLSVFEIDTPEKLRAFGETHNRNILELLNKKEDQIRLGVHAPRLREALFDSEEKLDRLEANCSNGAAQFSQSDLARFLVEYMSFERCRSTVKILTDAGFLKAFKSPFGAILISSSGQLEDAFADHIRLFRRALDDKLGSTASVSPNLE